MEVQTNTVLPTRAEMRILQVLWEISQGTVEDVISHPSLNPRPNYKTTQTILRIMEEKGLVRHVSRGRVFVFEPCVSRDHVGRLSVQTLLEQYFCGSPAELLVEFAGSRSCERSGTERTGKFDPELPHPKG